MTNAQSLRRSRLYGEGSSSIGALPLVTVGAKYLQVVFLSLPAVRHRYNMVHMQRYAVRRAAAARLARVVVSLQD